MNKNKLFVLGLVFLATLFVFLGTSCKKADDTDADIEVISNIASLCMTDMNGFSFMANSARPAAKCKPSSHHMNVSVNPSFIANPAPGHGQYSGYIDGSINASCDVSTTIMTSMSCVLGAVTTSGDKLGGTLYLNGSGKMIGTAITITIREFSGTTGLEVNGKAHTVDLTCTLTGTATGGTIKLSGHIDNVTINETQNF